MPCHNFDWATSRRYVVLAKTRLASAIDIPTADEAGVPDLHVSQWYGLCAESNVGRVSGHRAGKPSIALGPDFPHDLAKPLRFRCDERGELAWRVGNGLGPLVGHLFDD